MIGECKHTGSLADVIAFHNNVALLRAAVADRRMLDETLVSVWPKEGQQLELVVAAAYGWDLPYRGTTPRQEAKKLGIKVIEHDGAQWSYARASGSSWRLESSVLGERARSRFF